MVYGNMTDQYGNALAGAWVRLTQGSTSVLTQTDPYTGFYIFYDGEQCPAGGIVCSSGTQLNFAAGTSNAAVTVIGQGAVGDPAPAGWTGASATWPAGRSSAIVSGIGPNASISGTPNYSFAVANGSAYEKNWKFSLDDLEERARWKAKEHGLRLPAAISCGMVFASRIESLVYLRLDPEP